MPAIGDIIRQNMQLVQSTLQGARVRVRTRAQGLLPMPSSNPGGILGRLRGGGSMLPSGGGGGGVVQRIQEARKRLTGAAGAGALGGSKIHDVGPSAASRSGKIMDL